MVSKIYSQFISALISLFSFNVISKITGVIRDIIFSFAFGTSALFSSFLFAFSLPNLLRFLFGEGALKSSFIPILSQQEKKGQKQTQEFISNIVSIIFVLMCIISLIGSFVSSILFFFTEGNLKMTLLLISLLLPYSIIICLCAIFVSILNYKKDFFLSSLTFIILNILFICAGLISIIYSYNSSLKGIFSLVIAVWTSGILQFLILKQRLKNYALKLKWNFNLKSDTFKELKKDFFPIAFCYGASQISFLFDKFLAPLVGSYAISSLYYSKRIIYFVLGMFVFSISNIFLQFSSKFFAQNKQKEFKETFDIVLKQSLFWVFPWIIILFIYGQDILKILFLRGAFDVESLNYTLKAFYYYIPCLLAICLEIVIKPHYYIKKQTKIALKYDLFCLLLNVILGIILLPYLGISAIALSTTISSFIKIILLFYSFPDKKDYQLSKLLLPSFRLIICPILAFTLLAKVYTVANESLIYQILNLTLVILIGFSLSAIFNFILAGRETTNIIQSLKHYFKNKKN